MLKSATFGQWLYMLEDTGVAVTAFYMVVIELFIEHQGITCLYLSQ